MESEAEDETSGPRYSQLDPALRKLSPDALLLWGDRRARTQALQDILDGHDAGNAQALGAALQRIDAAVTEALGLLGLPRGMPVQLGINPFGPPGQLLESGELRIGPRWIRQNLNVARNPDTTFRMWSQETIHSRQPFAADYLLEYLPFPGYEEGLAEGLSLEITRRRAGMLSKPSLPYVRYVRGYELLAHELVTPPEELYRTLWTFPVGSIRL